MSGKRGNPVKWGESLRMKCRVPSYPSPSANLVSNGWVYFFFSLQVNPGPYYSGSFCVLRTLLAIIIGLVQYRREEAFYIAVAHESPVEHEKESAEMAKAKYITDIGKIEMIPEREREQSKHIAGAAIHIGAIRLPKLKGKHLDQARLCRTIWA